MSSHGRAGTAITVAATATLLVSAAGCSLAGPSVATWQPAPGQQVAEEATSFTVRPSTARAADCQGNDAVPHEVQLSEPLRGRTLVDGACASTEAGGTSSCAPDGTRSFT